MQAVGLRELNCKLRSQFVDAKIIATTQRKALQFMR